MSTPRGFGVSELGDIEVVPDGDELHLFHLTLPNHDVVQHAVSRDGLTWTPLPAALRTGDPGAVDDDQIWTMSVIRRSEGGYHMLYTALATADRGRVQRVAAATSDDLLTWTKSPHNPVAEADGRWYETDPAATGAVSWRDPKAVRAGDVYLATVCARENHGPLPRRGCVGLLASPDLERWEVRPPLFAPHAHWDLECPQLFTVGESSGDQRWYLTAAIMEDRSQRYWLADAVTGPFTVPPGGNLLAPAGHYAARVTHWHDLDLLFAWHQPRLHEGWLTSPRTIDWIDLRNPFGKFLAPPLTLTARADGSLALGSFPGWDAYQVGDWHTPRSPQRTLYGAAVRESVWRLDSTGAFDLLPGDAADDVLLEGTMTLTGARGGLALRLDDEACGLYLELLPETSRVTLRRRGIRRTERGAQRYAYDHLQRANRHEPSTTGTALPFRLLSVGPYVELSLAGEVAIATMTGEPPAGHWGFWVEDGSLAVSNLRCAAMRAPAGMEVERGA
jgi:beta-fructofuranosidase